MKTKECKFTRNNIRVGVSENGEVMLANADTNKIYKVNIVAQVKYLKPKGTKTIKLKISK